MKMTDFEVMSFDCYGTLIDWETGIYRAVEPLLSFGRRSLTRNEVLEAFAVAESEQEAATPAMPYPEVLASVHRRLAAEWHLDPPAAMHERFGASVPEWPAFPDSVEALQYLKKHIKLVILSNVDRASFRGSNARLRVEFDAIYTAEDIGSYKPSPNNFEYLISHVRQDLGHEKGDILHVAQSLFHDHEPAKRFGLATAWIDRRHDQDGWGATSKPAARPDFDFRFTSMADLVKAHEDAIG